MRRGVAPYGGCEQFVRRKTPFVGADSCLRPWIDKYLIRHGQGRATFPKGKVLEGRRGRRPLRTEIYHRSKIVTPQYAAVKGRRIAAALPRWDAHRTGQHLPPPARWRVVPSSARGRFQGGDKHCVPSLACSFASFSCTGKKMKASRIKIAVLTAGASFAKRGRNGRFSRSEKPNRPTRGVIFCALQNSAVGADSISARKLKKPHPSRLTPCHLPQGEGFGGAPGSSRTTTVQHNWRGGEFAAGCGHPISLKQKFSV